MQVPCQIRWRIFGGSMIWEQKLPTIVMLTKCFEERVNSQIVVIHRAFHKHVCAIVSLEKVRVLLA